MFLAIVLEDHARKVLQEFVPKPEFFPNVFCHHVTVWMNPTEEVMADYEGQFGAGIEIDVVGIAADEKGVALLVEQEDGLEFQNEFPHITIATAEGIPPKYSNELLKEAHRKGTLFPLRRFTLFGVFERLD